MKTKRAATGRSIASMIAGILAGSIVITPAVAHVTDELQHLYSHTDNRYYKQGVADNLFQEECEDGAVQAWARVTVSGSFVQDVDDSFSCRGVQIRAEDVGPGTYYVDFGGGDSRTFCVRRKVVATAESGLVVIHGTVDRQGGDGLDCWVRVDTYDLNGTAADHPFHIALLNRLP
jgi:hypothetical protein